MKLIKEKLKVFLLTILFHLGAHTDLEFCENNVSDTYLTNTLSVEHATYIANELEIPLLYISTAGVFDGKKEFYNDDDIPNPLCHYAKSKFAAEQYVQIKANKFLICRAGWMMGGGPKKDKKFINKIIQQIQKGSKRLHVVNDKSGTPTYTFDFANNVKILIEKEIYGLFNLVSEGSSTRYDVAKEILNILKLNNQIKLQSVDSSFFNKTYFVKRPKSEILINKKLNLLKLNIMRDWKICLKEYIKSDFNFMLFK